MRPDPYVPTTKPLVRAAGLFFGLIGLTMLGLSGWELIDRLVILRTWPEVQAEVIRSKMFSHVVTSERQERDSSDRSRTRTVRTNTTMYGAQLELRYTVNGQEYKTSTSAGYETSDAGTMNDLVERYAPGTRHAIRYEPSNPGNIRIEVGNNLVFFGLPLFAGIMGTIVTGFGALLLGLFRRKTAPALQTGAAGIKRN